MSFLKFSPNLFLEEVELKRLKRFLDDDGFRKFLLSNSKDFGVIENESGNNFSNALVYNGTSGTISHNDILFIDINGNLGVKTQELNISIPDDGDWYWIKISHQYSSNEVGIVSIDSNGNLTGVGTEFLTTLRGQPNFPSRIKFVDANLNFLEYDVLEVIDDQNAILQGVFQTETNIKYSVIGTFTPGYNATLSQKEVFQYDASTFELIEEQVFNTPPTFIAGEDFYIARVKYDSTISPSVVIQDKRSINIYRTKSDFDLQSIVRDQNILLGVEDVKWDVNLSTKDKNIVYVSWSFRSSNFSVNTNTNQVTLNAGLGGRFKTVNDFQNGDFNGWRLYTSDGKYSKILNSISQGGQINLTLEKLHVDSLISNETVINQELLVTPDAESIEIIASANPSENTELPFIRETFPINTPVGKIKLLVYKNQSCIYNIRYRYKTFSTYSQSLVLLDDLQGYYAEINFDTLGNIVASPVRTPYLSDADLGFIQLTAHPLSYSNQISLIDLGDLKGVEERTFVALDSEYLCIVGFNRQYQLFNGSAFALNNDKVIKLNNGLVNGNQYFFQFTQLLNSGSFSTSFVDQSDNPLYTFSQNDFTSSNGDTGLFFIATWNGTSWIITRLTESIVNELNSRISDIEAGWSTFNELTGFTAATGTVTVTENLTRYKKIGKTVHLNFAITGSLSSPTLFMQIPLPAAIELAIFQVIASSPRNVLNGVGDLPCTVTKQATSFLTFQRENSASNLDAGPFVIRGNVTYETT